MKINDTYPIFLSAQSVVLLIFMPVEWADRQQWNSLTALAKSLQEHLGSRLRVLRIDQANHADVFRSFAITKTPTFILVRLCVELWRQEGLTNEPALMLLIQRRLYTENYDVR